MLKKFSVSVTLLATLGNLAWASDARANFNGKLTVEIDGLKNKEGQVCINLFSSSQGFPGDAKKSLNKQCLPINQTPLIVTFDNLKAGSYAVAAIHDRNRDKTLNSNNLGIPTEGFAFSRNPEIRTSAPKFGDAAIILAGPNTAIQIQMKYF
jgi:uncharacterized protein (DUF2141 family)